MGTVKRDRDRIDAVLNVLKNQAPLSIKQEKFCNDACVDRFLKSKGDSVRKAAKQLRAALTWRDAVGADRLIADEFPEELAEGSAYVAGHDAESRPVVILRIKPDYLKSLSQKSCTRLLVFTFEVAISSMTRLVEQFVLIFDASFFRSASAFLNLLVGTLKLLGDRYPGRLHRAFVVDPPSLFPYLWKGVRSFVELSAVTSTVSSLDFEDDGLATVASYPRPASHGFDKGGGRSTSARFSFTVSHMDARPWYLSTAATSSVAPAASPSLVGASPLNARSQSFASPGGRYSRSVPSTPLGAQQKRCTCHCEQQQAPRTPRTPRPSFLQSPAAALLASLKGEEGRQQQGRREAFLPYLRLYRRSYDEVGYRVRCCRRWMGSPAPVRAVPGGRNGREFGRRFDR